VCDIFVYAIHTKLFQIEALEEELLERWADENSRRVVVYIERSSFTDFSGFLVLSSNIFEF